MKNIEKLVVSIDSSIEETMVQIQHGAEGIALVVDEKDRLRCTITDGDIRRAILNKHNLSDKITSLFKKPIIAPQGTSHKELLRLMKEKGVRHIPVLNVMGRVVELVLLSELIEKEAIPPLTAVVMAGGKGQRLYPLTQEIPKPMLSLEGAPLIQRTIKQLQKVGIKKVLIATHYKAEVITNHFKNGHEIGVDIAYINEERPLGTAGALGLMTPPQGTTLVINGDIVTQLNFQAMYDFHRTHEAVMTVGLSKYELKIPYGVVETKDIAITHLIEKPVQTFLVNAGIYFIEPVVYQYVSKKEYMDMTELIRKLLETSCRVISFPIQEYWLDVGLYEDYKRVMEDIKNGKI